MPSQPLAGAAQSAAASSRSPAGGSGFPSRSGGQAATATPSGVADRGVGHDCARRRSTRGSPGGRRRRAARRTGRPAPGTTSSRALEDRCRPAARARARLSSSRTPRDERQDVEQLSATTARPTMSETPTICLALMPRCKGESGSLLPQLQPVQLVVQRLQADAEDLGRARLVVARVLERHLDQPPLRLFDGRARARAPAPAAAPRPPRRARSGGAAPR